MEHSAVSDARVRSWMLVGDGHLAYLRSYSGREVHLGDDGGGLAAQVDESVYYLEEGVYLSRVWEEELVAVLRYSSWHELSVCVWENM